MDLFQMQNFTSHSGLELDWKIECDALSPEELEWAAYVMSGMVEFGRVVGIPRGGVKLAEALEKYTQRGSNVTLVVDDVITTGESMVEYIKKTERKNSEWLVKGISIFSRVVMTEAYKKYTSSYSIQSIFNFGLTS